MSLSAIDTGRDVYPNGASETCRYRAPSDPGPSARSPARYRQLRSASPQLSFRESRKVTSHPFRLRGEIAPNAVPTLSTSNRSGRQGKLARTAQPVQGVRVHADSAGGFRDRDQIGLHHLVTSVMPVLDFHRHLPSKKSTFAISNCDGPYHQSLLQYTAHLVAHYSHVDDPRVRFTRWHRSAFPAITAVPAMCRPPRYEAVGSARHRAPRLPPRLTG